MTVTVYGTGTLHAAAVDERLALPEPVPGLVVTEQERGFRAEMTASMAAFSAVRELTRSMPAAFGTDPAVSESAELVVSELTGNVVRATPENEPVVLIVEVRALARNIEVIVHDAVPGQPHRRDVALDSAEAVSGRGFGLLELLTDGWTVQQSPEPSFAKLIRCRISSAE